MKTRKPRIISGGASVLLDTLRLGASLTVIYFHARDMWFPNLHSDSTEPGDMAHAAVVVFFVLSGYVIAHTTTGNNRGPRHYALARLSRLYSVVLPALLFTAVIEFVLTRIDPILAAEHRRSPSWPRYFVTGSFLNEIWFLSAAPPINRPLWSLGFEFWYYLIFGCWFYRPASIKGLLVPAIACLIAGPKILVMMPLWIAGMVAYRMPRPYLPPLTAWALVGVSLLGAGLLVLNLPPFPFRLGYAPFFFAGQFLTDWASGLFVAVALWILPSATVGKGPVWIGHFRQIADLTFPLYVLHFPLLVLWQGFFGRHLYNAWQMALALFATLIIASLLGLVLERQRSSWVNIFKLLLDWLPIEYLSQQNVLQSHYAVRREAASAASVVVYATQHMPTGGIESHLQEFCRNLTESGIIVDLVIRNSAMTPSTEAYFRRICRQVYLGKRGSAPEQLFWLSWVSLQLLARRYQALYTNGQGSSIWYFAQLLRRRRHWVHHHHTAGDAADQATWDPQYYKALLVADTVIACSRRNADDMQGILGRSVQNIPCFSRQIVRNSSKQRRKLHFGYYGRLIPEKGIDILCQLSQDPILDDIEFHIWGEGDAYPRSFFAEYSHLHYNGPFSSKDELKEVLTNLDAYLLLSSHPEGLPISLLEVMSAGLPWLATDRGGVADIACDPLATRVISVTATYDEIKAAITALAADIRQGKLSENKQQALYSQRFSARVLVDRWRATLGLAEVVSTTMNTMPSQNILLTQ
jgi:peptidoglycan/LPS O-acetylase OafA/YrhL